MTFPFVFADPIPEMTTNKEQSLVDDDGVGEPPALEPPSALEVERRTYDLSKIEVSCLSRIECCGLSLDAAVAMKMRIQNW